MQELLGHSDVSTTMIYTHVLKVGGGGVASPLDAMVARGGRIDAEEPRTSAVYLVTHNLRTNPLLSAA